MIFPHREEETNFVLNGENKNQLRIEWVARLTLSHFIIGETIMSDVQVVYLTVDQIYLLENLIDEKMLDGIDEENSEDLEEATESLYRSRHYRHQYEAFNFISLTYEQREALEKKGLL